MSKIKSVAVMYGSDSSEWEVSCRSGEFTASRIDEFKYDVYEIFARHGEWSLVAMRKANSMRIPFPEGARPQIDKNDFSVNVLGEKVKFDYVYIMQHGAPGETGLLQGYFEMLGIPFSSCSAFVTTVAFNKFTCKNYLRDLDFVKLAPDAFINKGMDVEAFSKEAVEKLGLPVFVKPRRGSGSVGARKVADLETLKAAFEQDPSLIAQELMTGEGAFDLDADIYIDTVSHEPVAIFSKRKISTTIGGANKTFSFKDEKLFAFIREALRHFQFNGPIDADFFYKDGEYYLSEINPRFGGAYLHAYGAGVDFIRLIEKNLRGEANESQIGQYEDGVVMMMYDSVVIKKSEELAR